MIKRKALSPVISALILSAAVIAVGGGLWSFSLGASTVYSEDYINVTLEVLYDVTERFVVEHVYYENGADTLNVTVYNYGLHKITVNVTATITTTTTSFRDFYNGTVIQKGDSTRIDILLTETVYPDDRASINIQSWRENNAYKRYIFP